MDSKPGREGGQIIICAPMARGRGKERGEVIFIMQFYVYILASRKNGTLYIGMTDNLEQRVWQHKEKLFKGFTSKYGVDKLVWYELHGTRNSAYARERAIKKWQRKWKIELIEKENPYWEDLSEDWYFQCQKTEFPDKTEE